MKATLLGIRVLDFTGNDGNAVKGTQLHVAFAEDGIDGHAVDKLFVKPEVQIPKGIKPGDEITIMFNRRGKAVAITAA
jgi:hypothetical protein